jgi:ribosomal protein S18 acetylase RimI-like enzyme
VYPVQIRDAAPDDASAMGHLHVASWREAYAGLMPDAMLADLSVAARVEMWRVILGSPAAHGVVSVLVAEDAGALVGLASCGRQRDSALKKFGFDGEISAVYLLQTHQRAGLGRRLMARMGTALAAQGLSGASVWVLRENIRARAFYERLGGQIVGEATDLQTTDSQGDVTLAEVAYGWRDLSVLSRLGKPTRSIVAEAPWVNRMIPGPC